MVRIQLEETVHATPDEFLDLVMDIERYAQVDEKIHPRTLAAPRRRSSGIRVPPQAGRSAPAQSYSAACAIRCPGRTKKSGSWRRSSPACSRCCSREPDPGLASEHCRLGRAAPSGTLPDSGDRSVPAPHAPEVLVRTATSSRPCLADVDPRSELAQQELFGPVLSIIPFGTDDEAIDIANNTRYGLSSYVHNRDLQRGLRLAEDLVSGEVLINGAANLGAYRPFGGWGLSGLGKEGGREDFEEFLRTKSIAMAQNK